MPAVTPPARAAARKPVEYRYVTVFLKAGAYIGQPVAHDSNAIRHRIGIVIRYFRVHEALPCPRIPPILTVVASLHRLE